MEKTNAPRCPGLVRHRGCPKDRFLTAPDGPGMNYLCAGYKLVFHPVTHLMNIAADLLRQVAPLQK
ncbi:MAG: hypothetical protein ACOYYS_26925 [Chloroflexota bacterium]